MTKKNEGDESDREDEDRIGEHPPMSRLRRALRRSSQTFVRGKEVQK